jgi:hypothetical protein
VLPSLASQTSETVGVGEGICGRTTTAGSWGEAFISDYVTFSHSASSLTLSFNTNLNFGGTDESWGLVGVAVYLSSS